MFRLTGVLIAFSFLVQTSHAQAIYQNSGTTNLLTTVHFINDNIGWCAGVNGTILKTTNGGENWTNLSNGTNQNITSIFFITSKIGYYTVNTPGAQLFKTTDAGISWELRYYSTVPGLTSIYFSSLDTGYVTYCLASGSMILRTLNGGLTWDTTAQLQAGKLLYKIKFINKTLGWSCGRTNDLSGQILMKTTDAGESWSYNINSVGGKRFNDFAFSDSLRGFVIGDTGFMIRTTDGGDSWFYSLVLITTDQFRAIQFTQNRLYILEINRVYYSLDQGNQWSPGYPIFSEAFAFPSDSIGYLVGNHGVIAKTENGALPVELISFTGTLNDDVVHLAWSTSSEVNNRGFEIQRKNGNMDWRTVAFKPGAGTITETQYYTYEDKISGEIDTYFYRLKQMNLDGSMSLSSEIQIQFFLPDQISIYQNYPNPFNSSTKIKFSIPQDSFIKLSIYDLLGSNVIDLISEEREKGIYELEYNFNKLTSGFYYYRLSSNGSSLVKKMLYLK